MPLTERGSIRANTELVAFGIGHENPANPGLFDRRILDMSCAQVLDTLDFSLHIVDNHIEMKSILDQLCLGNSLKNDLGAIANPIGHDRPVLSRGSEPSIAEHLCPELGLRVGVVTVNGDVDPANHDQEAMR